MAAGFTAFFHVNLVLFCTPPAASALGDARQVPKLLATGQIEELFKYIRQVAAEPLILVDLPPILSADDALVMAPKLDACLLVLAEGKSRRDSTAKALEMLVDFNIAGIVLNRSRAIVKDYYSS